MRCCSVAVVGATVGMLMGGIFYIILKLLGA